MSKGKAIICSGLLAVVMFALLIATLFIKGIHDVSLYNLVSGFIVGNWIGNMVTKFYHWLMER